MKGPFFLVLGSLCFMAMIHHTDSTISEMLNKVVFGKYLPNESFRRFHGISLTDCAKECAARKRCHSINFVRKLAFCYLNQNTTVNQEGSLSNSRHFVFTMKQDWTDILDTTGCDDACNDTEKCTVSDAGVTCSDPDCGPPPNITNGYFHGNVWTVGKTVKYACAAGYNLTGSQTTSTCTNGTWSGPTPTCEWIIVCGVPPTITGGYYHGNAGVSAVDSTVAYDCDTGYVLTSSSSNITCNNDGTWTQPPTCQPVCGVPPTVTNGYPYGNGNVWTAGSTVAYGCGTGYTLSGCSDITCNNDGTWTQPPTCQPVPLDCEPGWQKYNDSTCILLVQNTMLWPEAKFQRSVICNFMSSASNFKANCEYLSAGLVQIKDTAKNDFVGTLVYNPSNDKDYWLGATAPFGSWSWLDGSSLAYTANCLATPSYEACLIMMDLSLSWEPALCTTGMYSICEKSLT